MRRRLVIVFDEFPFTFGEYSFVKTELEYLTKYFEICILSLSTATETEPKVELDSRITLYHCIREFGMKQKAFAVIQFLLSRYGQAEIKRILRTRQKIMGRLYDAIVYFSSAKQLQKFIRKNRLLRGDELIYSYWFNANCLAFLMEKRRYPKLRVISRIHGYDLYNERNIHDRQPFRERMNRMIDKIFFVGDTGKQYYLEHWPPIGDENEKYMVAPIGTVNSHVSHRRISMKEGRYFHIVSCSSVISLKRVHLIIEGLAQIADINMKWTHFGSGNLLDEMKKRAQALLGRKDNISYDLAGFVPVEDIMQFYENNDIDCFITTSSTEGCPVSIQEAMSYGIPVIATAVGEIPNMIHGNGVLLPENPLPQDVGDAISRVYAASEEEVFKMRERSRALWEKKYNAMRNAEIFVHELKKIV